MPETTYLGFALRQILIALGLLAIFLIAAWFFNWVLVRTIRKMADKTATNLDNFLLDSLRRPIYIGLIVCGLYFAAVYLPLTGRVEKGIVTGGLAAFAALGIYAAASVVDGLLKWYATDVAPTTSSGLDDQIVSVLRWLAPIVAGLLGLFLVLDMVGVDIPPVKSWLAAHGGRIALVIVLTLLAIFGVSHISPRIVKAAVAQRTKEDHEEEIKKRVETLTGVLVTTGEILIIAISSFMLLSEMGLDIAPLLTGIGVVGVAIGFGAQNVVKDILAGLFVILENQYRVGDVVKIADVSGVVEDINLRRTRLRDLDGAVHVVPNGEIRVASNLTRGWARVNFNISVAYDADLDHCMAVINRVGKEMAADPAWAPSLIKPPQAIRVDKLGDSGIDIKVMGDTKPLRQWDVTGELMKRLKKAFDEEHIEIPWPHTKVYFGNSPFPAQNTDKK